MPAPQFTPTGGIGTTYKDPQTGEVYEFTAQGWVKQTKKEEIIEKPTFEVKPDEEEDVNKLKSAGFDDNKVSEIMVKRRRALANQEQQKQVEPIVEKDTSAPFGGMSKQEMLKDAFNKGASKKDLDELSGIYEMVVGTEEELIDTEKFDLLSPEQQEQTREKLRKIVATKAMELGTGAERQGVLGALGTFDTGQEVIDFLESGSEEEVKTGLIPGIMRIFGRPVGKTSEREDEFNALTTVYTAQFIRAISGLTVSDKERRFLNKALPNETKTRQNNIAGIEAIEEWMSNAYTPYVGVSLDPLKSSESDPMKIFSDEENKNPLGI